MKRLVLALLPAFLIAGALLVPLPYYVLSPGSAIQVEDRVQLGRAPDPVSGDLLLLTVRLARATPVRWVLARLDDDDELLDDEEIIPEGVDDAQYLESQRQLFRETGQVAAAVGLRRAGLEIKVTGKGARIERVEPGGPADGSLRVGDVVQGFDGKPVALASDLIADLSTRSAGDRVTLTVHRGETDLQVPVTLGTVEGVDRAALGVRIQTVDLEIVLPVSVDVEQGGIGGPSAGLMIALAVFDLTDPVDLTRSRVIAGTGTIDLEGRVGPVGGVRQKVRAAEKAGATLMFAPLEEADEARALAGGGLEIVPVRTLDDAVARLLEGGP